MIASIEPAQVYAGDTVEWTLGPNESIQAGMGTEFDVMFSGPGISRDYLVSGTGRMQDYPPSDWDLHYVLKNKDQSFAFDATDGGQGDYVISADSSQWAPGKYLLLGYVSSKTTTERHVVRSTPIQVFLNPASDGPADFRTPARQIYEQILADEVRGVFVNEYTVGSRHCRYTTPKERDYMRRVWAHKVAVEEGKLSSFGGVTFSL